jgi:L-amino acid N-acyltransferase YncA
VADPAIRLRLARPDDDAAACLAIYRPWVEESTVSFETEVPSLAAFAERMRAIMATHAWLVAEADGEVIGYAYGSAHRQRAAYRFSVEVSAYIHRNHHRRGIAARLYRALFAVLRAQGYVTAYAGITLPNPASERFHAAMGFEPVGTYRHVGFKQGGWHDVTWSSLALASPPAVPGEPRALAALDESMLHKLLDTA